MKLARISVLIAALTIFAACGGGSSGSSPAEDQAEAAFDDFAQQFITCLDQAGFVAQAVNVQKQVEVTCNCETSGTIVFTEDLPNVTVAINQCVTAAGNTYNGTFTSTDSGDTINGTLEPFGQCSSGTANNIDGVNCTGSLSITCPAGPVNCTVTDSSEPDECDLNC